MRAEGAGAGASVALLVLVSDSSWSPGQLHRTWNIGEMAKFGVASSL